MTAKDEALKQHLEAAGRDHQNKIQTLAGFALHLTTAIAPTRCTR